METLKLSKSVFSALEELLHNIEKTNSTVNNSQIPYDIESRRCHGTCQGNCMDVCGSSCKGGCRGSCSCILLG